MKLHDITLFTATVVDLLDDDMVTYEISDENGKTLALFDAPAKRPTPVFPDEPEGDSLDFLMESGPTVGYCEKCGEARTEFYVCRDGGATVAKEAAPITRSESGPDA